MHGTFIVGLPGETRQTIQETIAFARELNPHTLQVSLAAAYPGTELYRQATERGWLQSSSSLVSDAGTQVSCLAYPELSAQEIFRSVDTFYRRFYFRPRKMLEMLGEMLTSWAMFKRRIREGVEFARFLRTR